jgi:hypothetical protein
VAEPELLSALVDGLACGDPAGARHAAALLADHAATQPAAVARLLKDRPPVPPGDALTQAHCTELHGRLASAECPPRPGASRRPQPFPHPTAF